MTLSLFGAAMFSPTVQASVDGPRAARPCDVTLMPGSNLPADVPAAGAGAKVCLKKGEYRITQPIHPAEGQLIEGKGRAVLIGSEVLGGFTAVSSNVWASAPTPASSQRTGECLAGTANACRLADAVFADGQPLRRVMALEDLQSGTFWYDREDEQVYIYGNPHGQRIEMAVTPVAITPDPAAPAADVTVRGLTVEMFATPAQHGAIDVTAPGWTIAQDTVEENHGEGVTTEGHAKIEDVRALENGQEGIGGTGADTTVVGCQIEGNNWAAFDPGWEAGGAKWSVASELTVRENTVRDNLGPGLWSDIDSSGVTYEENTVTGNESAGIFYEISSDATIAHNVVRGNGFGANTWLWGAGILLAGSHDVSVRDNTLSRNADGVGLIQQERGVSERDGTPRVLHDVSVEDNVEALGEGSTGAVQDDGDEAIFSDPTITFSDNTYTDFSGSPFSWADRELDGDQWRAVGHDVKGTFKEKAHGHSSAGRPTVPRGRPAR